MEAHWSGEYIAFIRSVIPEIAETPIYILRVDESPVEFHPSWRAMFGSFSDIQAQPYLEACGLWSGRGLCITVADDFASWSNRCQHGVLLHEAAHGLEYLRRGDALCPVENLGPLYVEVIACGVEATFAKYGVEHGPTLLRMQHGLEFVRIACHLYWRSRNEMPLSPADVQFLDESYSLPPEKFEAVTEALAAELAMSHNLNLLRLRAAPEAFERLFNE